MRVIFPLPPLLVASAALGGLFAPFAVGSVPTDSIGIAAATEGQFGADVAICHGSASAGLAVGGARRGDVQDHDRERAGAVLFQSRAPAYLRVQSQRGAARLSQGAEARS